MTPRPFHLRMSLCGPPHGCPAFLPAVLGLVVAVATTCLGTPRAAAETDAHTDGLAFSSDAGVAPDQVTSPEVPPPSIDPVSETANRPVLDVETLEVVKALNGQDLDTLDLEALLENVVVTATKFEVKEDEVPAIMTVITRDDIQQWGYASVAEVLRHVAGVYVIDDHIIPNVSIRGISGGLRSESGLVKVMIDGHSVAFHSTSGNWLGPELIPLSAIQQIEVIRGPASALYGADAFLGVINVVTRQPSQCEGGQVGVDRNHEGGYGHGEDMALASTVGHWQVLASFKSSSEDRSGLVLPSSSPGPRLPDDASADLRSRDLTLNSTVGLVRVSYEFGSRGSLALMGYVSEIDRGAEFSDWAQLTHSASGQNGTNVSLRQQQLGLDLALRLSPTLDLRANGLLFSGGPTSRDHIEVGSDLFYVKRDFGYVGVDAGTEVTWHPNRTFNVLVGASALLDREKLPTVYDVTKVAMYMPPPGAGGPPGGGPPPDNGGPPPDDGSAAPTANVLEGTVIPVTSNRGHVTLRNVGVNALVMWSPRPGLSLACGGRYDEHSVYGGKLSGRLGGVIALRPDLHFKLLYGSAFKAPSPQLLYGAPLALGDIAGNEKLKPSYVQTVEAQFSFHPNRHLWLASGLAYNYLLDQAAFVQQGSNQVAANVFRIESLSWESELRFNYRRKLAAYGNLSVNHTQQKRSGDNYIGNLSSYSNAAYPIVVANAGVSAEIPTLPLRLGGEVSYVSSRRSSPANTLDAGRMYELPPYALLGGSIRTVGLRLIAQKETILRLVVRNTTNTTYADPGFAGIDYPQLGRTFMAQVIQEF
jgi:outer membrane receptor for ferrienterochelin and colicins